MRSPRSAAGAVVLAGLTGATADAAAQCPVSSWKLVGSDTFTGADALLRSQGVTTDDQGWFFSWQGGIQHTLDDYTPTAYGPITPMFVPSVNPDGTNSVADTHIGDIDYYKGRIYAPEEDGGEGEGPINLNDPEYQHPHIAVYDAKTLTYTGTSYALDPAIHEAGVPWVAIDAARRTVYTAEWEMPHDRLNVFDLHMGFKRFLTLHYPPSLGPGFRLSRIQGAKVWGHTMYATRDDAAKTVFAIDLRTGEVTRLFSLAPGGDAELEGLAVRPTSDGALLHLLIVLDNKLPDDATSIHVAFEHFAPVRACGAR